MPHCGSRNQLGAKVRNDTMLACKRLGRRIWKTWSGYHRRSLVETKMHCFKRTWHAPKIPCATQWHGMADSGYNAHLLGA